MYIAYLIKLTDKMNFVKNILTSVIEGLVRKMGIEKNPENDEVSEEADAIETSEDQTLNVTNLSIQDLEMIEKQCYRRRTRVFSNYQPRNYRVSKEHRLETIVECTEEDLIEYNKDSEKEGTGVEKLIMKLNRKRGSDKEDQDCHNNKKLRLETLNNERSNEISEKGECSKKRKIDYKDDDEVIKKSKIINEDTSNNEWLNEIEKEFDDNKDVRNEFNEKISNYTDASQDLGSMDDCHGIHIETPDISDKTSTNNVDSVFICPTAREKIDFYISKGKYLTAYLFIRFLSDSKSYHEMHKEN